MTIMEAEMRNTLPSITKLNALGTSGVFWYHSEMVSADDVKKLAALSRLELTEEEVAKLQGEFTSILAYIDTIQKVELPETPAGSVYLDIENVTREDGEPHETGAFTDALLAQAPRKEGNYLKVKKILQ
jgi:aspartyl-tRNA(Asn)/glutamyl-tRNA(Gln) amidotransferase subunit C